MHSSVSFFRIAFCTTFCILFVLLFKPTALAQTLDDEIAKVREAITASTKTDERKSLEDYLNILEINAARLKRTPTILANSKLVEHAIETHSLNNFLSATHNIPLDPEQLDLVLTEYQEVCYDTLISSKESRKSALLRMAETYLKSESIYSGTNSQILARWFHFFQIIAPHYTNDETCTEIFEVLLVYMPDELTIYCRPADGMSILHLYVIHPVESYIALLLKLGFDKTLKNHQGQTAFDLLNQMHPSPLENIQLIKPLLAP